MTIRLSLLAVALFLASSISLATPDTWTCMGICGSPSNNGNAVLRISLGSSGTGTPTIGIGGSSGGDASALDAYRKASAACGVQNGGRLTSLGIATSGGLVVIAMPAEICVKNI